MLFIQQAVGRISKAALAPASTAHSVIRRKGGGYATIGVADLWLTRPTIRLGASYAPALRSAVTIRSGVSGMSVKYTSNGESACSIAEIIAAGAGMVPPSPVPLTPSGLSGFGVSTCSIWQAGTSDAAGRR